MSKKTLLASLVLLSTACTTMIPNEVALKNQETLSKLSQELEQLKIHLNTVNSKELINRSKELTPMSFNHGSELSSIEDIALLQSGFTLMAGNAKSSFTILADKGGPGATATPSTPGGPAPASAPAVAQPKDLNAKLIGSIESVTIGTWVDKPAKFTDKLGADSRHGFVKVKKRVDKNTRDLTRHMFNPQSTGLMTFIVRMGTSMVDNGFDFRMMVKGRIVSVDHGGDMKSGLMENVLIEPIQYACIYINKDAQSKQIGATLSWGYDFFNHDVLSGMANPDVFKDII